MVRRGRRFESVRGIAQSPANAIFVLPAMARSRPFAGTRRYILGLTGTRGHARRLATQPGTCSRHSIATAHSKSSCNSSLAVARDGAKLATSFTREGSTVRVRQRACREAPQKAGFLSSKPATHATPRVREAPRSAATRTRCRTSRSRGSPCRKRGRRPRAESRLAP